jgi:hypothetical protein
MAVRMISTGKIADAVIRAMGYEPTAYTLSGRDRTTLTDAVNEALAELYGEHKWPMLRRIERRTYRPAWSEDENYVEGDEVYTADAETDDIVYWRAADDNTGAAPSDTGTAWTRITTGMAKFIQFAQPWEAFTMDECGIDLDFFAFENDPKVYPNQQPIKGCTFWMDSVVLPADAPNRVYAVFVPLRPQAEYTEWSAGTAYAAGEACYRTLTGNTYAALAGSTGRTPEENAEYWTPVGVPDIFAKFLRLRAEAAWRQEDDGRARAANEADDELERLAGACITRTNSPQGGWSAGR